MINLRIRLRLPPPLRLSPLAGFSGFDIHVHKLLFKKFSTWEKTPSGFRPEQEEFLEGRKYGACGIFRRQKHFLLFAFANKIRHPVAD
jgi:hypothetical protein